MRYVAKENRPDEPEIVTLREALETIVRNLGLELIELSVSRKKGRKGAPGTAQVRAVVYKSGLIGVNDCSRVHHALLPRLEEAFLGQDLSVEVSSPGIDRLIRDGAEFAHYKGRGVRCYRTDSADWTAGVLETIDEKGIVLKRKEGNMRLEYEIISKARLDSLPVQEVEIGN